MAVEENFQAPINNPIEKDIDRDAYVLNQGAGTLAFSNTTGQQRVQLTHRSGSNLKLDNRSFSVFSPNTYQTLTHGKRFETTLNDTFNTCAKNVENRSYGDFRIISGSPNLFNDSIAQEWVDTYAKIAEAIVTPEKEVGGIGNVTGKKYPLNGSPNSESGAVEGGSYSNSKIASNVQETMIKTQKRLTEIEKQMGIGGNIEIQSARSLLLQAGAAACKYDTGVIVENGRHITMRWKVDDPIKVNSKAYSIAGRGGEQPVMTSTPNYMNANSSGQAPFGEMTISAGNKIEMVAGSGGISINSTGEAHLTSNGRLSLGGGEVNIGSSTKNNAGAFRAYIDSDIFLRSERLWHSSAPQSMISAEQQITFAAPKTHVTNDTYIHGPLQVHKQTIFNNHVHIDGHLHVDGNITCSGNVFVHKDVIAGSSNTGALGISLLKHHHRGDRGCGHSPCLPNTGRPTGNS